MESRFLCFRFFIVPVEQHLFTKPVEDVQKLDWFRTDFLRNRDHRAKKGGAEYALFITERTHDFVLGKLCKKRIYELHEKGSEDINLRAVEDWPYVEFLADLRPGKQLILIRENTGIFREIKALADILTAMANDAMFLHGYATSFEPLVEPDSFWSEVAHSDGVFRLKFTLKSPNLFGADSDANEALGRLRNVFNNTETQIVLKNEKGNLELPHDELETYRDYADRGGGSWALTVKRNGKPRRIKSEERAVRITIEIPEDGNLFNALKQALQSFLDAA